MARLNVLEYAADFVRGWPHGEAVQMNYSSIAGAEFGNGDLVQVGDGGVEAAADNAAYFGVVARGVKDTFNGGGTGTGNLYKQTVPNIVILGNYVVRTSNVNATGLAAGAAIGVVGGQWDVAATASIGTVLEVESNVTLPDGTTGSVAVIHVR
jgi:hypothetical protein